MKKLKHIWVFSDSIKGHEVQSMALANKLAAKVELFHCAIRQPWLSFAPRILPRFGRNIIWQKNKPDTTNKPDVIISCGRRMAAVGKYYKRLLKVKHTQILNPTDNPQKYDVLICPQHDDITGDNVITCRGSLHGINIDSLAKIKCSDPIDIDITVFIGNPTAQFFKKLELLAEKIKQYYPQHKLAICGSRRTPKKYRPKIRQAFQRAKQVWLADNDGANPYIQLLACSDILIVTADSINMLSEACASDKMVIAIGQDYISAKHKKFIVAITDRLSEFADKDKNQQYKPLETLNTVTKQVLEKL